MDDQNTPTLSADTALEGLEVEAAAHLENSLSKNTRRAYQADWEDFRVWCSRRNFDALPASARAVALYITEIAHALKVASIERRLVTIKQAHLLRKLPTPTDDAGVRKIWRAIRKEKTVAQTRKSPTLTTHIRKMIARVPADLMGLRDRALLLIGFAGAMRRSDLTNLDVSDLEFTDEGVVILVRKSKTDQIGIGRKIGIPFGSHPATCPVRAVKEWLAASALCDGPLFRGLTNSGALRLNRLSDRMVARIVQRCVKSAGYDAKLFAGHSLRAGLATAAAQAGASERSIQNQTGHKSVVTLRRYIRDGSLFKDNAAAKVGL